MSETTKEEKHRFEVKMRTHPNGSIEKAIFIDGEMLDWTIDISSYMEAVKMGPKFRQAVHEDIAKHFLYAVSETIGRQVTIEDIQQASKTGWI